VTAWASAPWRAAAVAWLDERLAAAGLERTGEVEQPHLRPWATVLRAPTSAGAVWLKAASPGTAFEVALYELLARAVPDRVLVPLACDPARGWVLLPDGGPSLGVQEAGAEALTAALAEYGRLQRRLEPYVEEMLALGVPDMRPGVMVERFHEALAAVGGHPEVEAMEPQVVEWCERLAASPLPPSLDHNDLHPWNILVGPRYYDWGDSVVAHPFAAMLVPLSMMEAGREAARDAYLDVFADRAPRAELVETLALARRVATIARALTWERAIRTAREQGEAVDEDWVTAPAATLAELLDDGASAARP
jgi:hypothetical protein